MISTATSALSRRHANCCRALSYLLLLLIAYGATVEAVHSHGRVSLDHSGIAAISDLGESHTPHTDLSHQRECSMCQFQKQLFDGLVHAPLLARTPLAEVAFVSALTVFYPSTSTPPPSGRAPPLG